jgi:hypothetical protein
MSDAPMTGFPVPDTDDLPADVRERIEAETERAGFTPNVFLAFAYRPAQFRAVSTTATHWPRSHRSPARNSN